MVRGDVRLLRFFRTLLRYRLRDPRGAKLPPQDRKVALAEAVHWLLRSEDSGPDDGSSCFGLRFGWTAGYPEVTGYILYTLLKYHKLTREADAYNKYATRMADWELSVQLPCGGFQGGYVDSKREPVAFNTAQVMQGLTRAYEATQDERYVDSACRAGDWLVEIQEEDGAWCKHVYLGEFRVTDSRIAFPLLQLWRCTGDRKYHDSAIRSLAFVSELQHANGWFPLCDNSKAHVHEPLVHTLAYTCEGLLKSGILLQENSFVECARCTADALLRRFEVERVLRGRLDSRWRGTVNWACLTGCAQASEIWSLLSLLGGDVWYLNAALRMNDYLCAVQDLTTRIPGIRGALPGSEPFGGGYHPHAFPSWATKYFCDALMCEDAAFEAVVLREGEPVRQNELESLL